MKQLHICERLHWDERVVPWGVLRINEYRWMYEKATLEPCRGFGLWFG